MKTLIKILCLSVLWFSCEEADCDPPNGMYDPFEEYEDLNSNNQYDNGEPFIDEKKCCYGWPVPYHCDCDWYDQCGKPCGDGLPFGACDCDGNDFDNCGICGGDNQAEDCNGDCFGDATLDVCGVCDGPGAIYGEGCCMSQLDECGICYGNNEDQIDRCGNCQGQELEWVELWEECYEISSTTYLNLSHNDLSGEISPIIGNLTNLENLYLGSNSLSGEIPSEIGNLIRLNNLVLDFNQLSGIIPDEICYQGDDNPSVRANKLCPPYPSCISQDDIDSQDTSNCTDDCIDEDEDDICDNIDDCVGEYDVCGVCNGDEINPCDCEVYELEWVELWGECYNIEETTSLDLHNDGLTGEIPSEIGNLINLEYLYLGSNSLSGEIPSEINNLHYLEILDLSNNLLVGELPFFDQYFMWGMFVYNNQLEGIITDQICDNINPNDLYWSFDNNNFCPPYPICSGNPITTEENQDTSNCP